jgi:hypothetical protein
MNAPRLSLDDFVRPSDRFVVLYWDAVRDATERIDDPDEQTRAWNGLLAQWTARLTEQLGDGYGSAETESFFLTAPKREECLARLTSFVERCRTKLIASLPENASLSAPGKQVVIVIAGREPYYDYLAHFDAEGHYGGSGGMHVRKGYPHTVAHGWKFHELEAVIAHELTHAALHPLDMPVWIEEGLTQSNECQIAGRAPLAVDNEVADEQKAFWRSEGLDDFWRGVSFHRPDEGQKLSYQLSEILLRLLFEDFRPRWFGFDKEPPRRLSAFLGSARSDDCGQAAAEEHLGMTVGQLAAKFLGRGDWEPRL